MTTDKEALFTKFLDYLQSEQIPSEYLGEPPSSAPVFDPYHMVSEWTALRHEVKQQGKLLHSTQDALVQALAVIRTEQEQMPMRLEESQKQASVKFEQQQEKLLKDLLGVVDALDQACTYWQEELEALSTTSNSKPLIQKGFWEKLIDWINGNYTEPSELERLPALESLTEIFTSNQQGVELIRRSLLEILKQRRVVPIVAQGKPFDSQIMYAVGRQSRADITENTVIQEVVRGYLWGDKVLREAQVIVATQK